MKKFNTIEKFLIEHKYVLFIIVFIIGVVITPKFSLIINIVNTTLILAILGLLYQIIFPETPLTSSKILSYILALIFLLVTITSIQYKHTLHNLVSKYISFQKDSAEHRIRQTEYIIKNKDNRILETITIIKTQGDKNGSK